mgnify:CR=1 FL=1
MAVSAGWHAQFHQARFKCSDTSSEPASLPIQRPVKVIHGQSLSRQKHPQAYEEPKRIQTPHEQVQALAQPNNNGA